MTVPVSYPCGNWDEFIKLARLCRRRRSDTGGPFGQTPRVIYRGHANPDWKLSSVLERELDGHPDWLAEYDRRCAGKLSKFREALWTVQQSCEPFVEDELWALGRHHGLSTPLLDWTASPYVAVFFALQDRLQAFTAEAVRRSRFDLGQGTVRLWGLRLFDGIQVAGEFEVVDVRPSVSVRLRAQGGCFTRLRHHEHHDLVAYLSSRRQAECLEFFDLPCDRLLVAALDLERMNITPLSLFPDLDGAAMHPAIDYAELRRAYPCVLAQSQGTADQ